MPNNLMPYIAQVAVGRREKLSVFGDDYPTPDGTGVRDYIHVDDLAAGHIAALNRLTTTDDPVSTWNLGTGHGTSVLELLHAFEQACGHELPYEIVARRPGDIAAVLRRPRARRGRARLARHPHRRRHVRRHLALAEQQPARLPRGLSPGRQRLLRAAPG